MPHIHEKIDYAADAFIVNGDAVLLRHHEKYHTWLPPGGHVELDEDFEEAAVREAKEETGLDVVLVGKRHPAEAGEKELLIPRFINRHPVTDVHEHISFMYFATTASREIVPMEGEAPAEIRWFTREDLRNPQFDVWDRVRVYAEAALDELSPR